jgi:hypothetical protein
LRKQNGWSEAMRKSHTQSGEKSGEIAGMKKCYMLTKFLCYIELNLAIKVAKTKEIK